NNMQSFLQPQAQPAQQITPQMYQQQMQQPQQAYGFNHQQMTPAQAPVMPTQTQAQHNTQMFSAPIPQVMMPPVQESTLPSIGNVQESIKSFTHEMSEFSNGPETVTFETTEVETTSFTPAMPEDLTSQISPVATNAGTTARDMLLAKAKAFRETQINQVVAPEKGLHPEQLSMMDEEKQFEDARKMARDILEVPAFIRKKQGLDLTNN
ncbi:MAG: hypothetical protein K2P92_00585, partial [Bdellovibrionaceae bacterium]|nr:hypothetical protein [Pseudobdellovibrionaceae bacterium]